MTHTMTMINHALTFEPQVKTIERETVYATTTTPAHFFRQTTVYRNLYYDTFSAAERAFEEARRLGMVAKVFIGGCDRSHPDCCRLQVRFLKGQRDAWNQFVTQQFGEVATEEDAERLTSLLYKSTAAWAGADQAEVA